MRRIEAATVLLAAAGASAQFRFTDTFESGSNAGGWTFGAPVESIDVEGNGNHFLHGSGLDTTVPFLRTSGASAFTGDYRARGIRSLSAGLQVIHTDFPVASFHPALVLYSMNGTAGTDDDWGAFTLSEQTLAAPGAWGGYGFEIPSQQASLPGNWTFIRFGPNAPASPSWDTLVRNVDRVMFSFGDPLLFYIFQMWDVGADNIGASQWPLCYANCDQSTTPPYLNINDFVCFLNKFSVGDLYANCDTSPNPPILNVNDFSCFLNRFAAGCSAP